MGATVRLIDQKGEKYRQEFNVGTFDEAAYIEGIASLSQCGTDGYLAWTDEDFTEEQEVVVNTLINNDGDFKAICSFKYLSGFIRLTIPAPHINIEAGIVIRFGETRSFIPPTKTQAEVGHDGNSIATALETALGLTAGDLTFSSGRLVKKA